MTTTIRREARPEDDDIVDMVKVRQALGGDERRAAALTPQELEAAVCAGADLSEDQLAELLLIHARQVFRIREQLERRTRAGQRARVRIAC